MTVEEARYRLAAAESRLEAATPPDVNDPARSRLAARALAQHHRNTDRDLERYTAALTAVEAARFTLAAAKSREAEANRVRLTADQVRGARVVRDDFGWHKVVRVSAKSVTVETGYSWTERIPLDKILQVA